MADLSDTEILIAGAGIGGLTVALSLHATGLTKIRLVEAAAEIRPLGVGLNILPNAVHWLQELGVFDAVAARAVKTADFSLYHCSGGLIWREPRGVAAGFRHPQLSVHRGHLQGALSDAVRARLGPDALVTGCRLTSFEQPSPGRVRATVFDRRSGTPVPLEADVLVGADGLRSAVRSQLYPAEGEPRTNGLVMWRGTTWAKPFLTGSSMAVIGDDRQKLVIYPIIPATASGDGLTLINWVTGLPASILPNGATDPAVRRETALQHFGGWRFPWIDVPALIRDASDILENPMEDRDPLPRWAFGQVVLLGDAAHPMYPVGSNGATQAIIDGRALAGHFATHERPAEALTAFEAERRPVMTRIQAANRQMGPERAIDIVHRRAPEGFEDISGVISKEELAAISAQYNSTAGLVTDLATGRQ